MITECEDDWYNFIDDSTFCKLCGSCMRDNRGDCQDERDEGYCDTCLAYYNDDQRDIFDLTLEEFKSTEKAWEQNKQVDIKAFRDVHGLTNRDLFIITHAVKHYSDSLLDEERKDFKLSILIAIYQF